MTLRSPIPLMLGVLAISFAAPIRRTLAQCNGASLRIHVDSVEAGETQPWIDPRLGPDTRGRLTTLFEYRSYRLVRTEEVDSPCGQPVVFELPAEHILHIDPVAIHGNQIALDLAMFVGARPVMRNQIKVTKGSMLFLIGSQTAQGAQLTTVRIDTADQSSAPESAPPNSTASPSPTNETPSLEIRGDQH